MPSSFGRLVLIVDRASGHRSPVARAMPAIEATLRAKGLRYRVHRAAGLGDATRAARAALLAGERFLVAVGGDGNVHEIVNGMFEDDRPLNPNAVLGVVSAGADGDFARTFGLPEDPARACNHLEGPNLYQVDVGKVRFVDGSRASVPRYFANVAGVGLGGAVAAREARLPQCLGRGRRFAGFWLTLPRLRPFPVRITADDRTFEGTAHDIVVANGQFSGGGMKISPRSWPGDGHLDVLVMTGPRSDAFTLLPRAYRGEHLPHPNIVELRATHVRIESQRSLPVQADGVPLGDTPAEFEVLPEALPVKV